MENVSENVEYYLNTQTCAYTQETLKKQNIEKIENSLTKIRRNRNFKINLVRRKQRERKGNRVNKKERNRVREKRTKQNSAQ